ncbi:MULTISPECIES: ABC-three component system middle component 6 [unclassified Serratia (in: enterobacteria)]|uniref:ABC-three component system middle component 6 n=1 Tax=unclassified Serratia (in: enterobacteria) TaxID=2647522 RepID=UPI0015F6BF21|nr:MULTISPECIES: ABC-three component system middle component 6 [unclassified Serratia (in: enterobacteria)]
MITIDTDPKANPVYIGARIIKIFQSNDSRTMDISRLYDLVNEIFELSFDLFLYSLDWLFAIGVIELDENGGITYAAQ